jgi:hypothetical protein
VRRLLVTASVVNSSPILVTLMKEALSPSETSVLTRITGRNIPEDAILHSHHRENLKSYLGKNVMQLSDFNTSHRGDQSSFQQSYHVPLCLATEIIVNMFSRNAEGLLVFS